MALAALRSALVPPPAQPPSFPLTRSTLGCLLSFHFAEKNASALPGVAKLSRFLCATAEAVARLSFALLSAFGRLAATRS